MELYITDLQIELHQKEYYEIEKMREYFSYSSSWVGYTHPFTPISEEEIDIVSIFNVLKKTNQKINKYRLLLNSFGMMDIHLWIYILEIFF